MEKIWRLNKFMSIFLQKRSYNYLNYFFIIVAYLPKDYLQI